MFVCLFLREYSDGLRDKGVADRALRVAELTDTDGTLHAEEVVTTRHQCSCHLALETRHAVPHGGRGVGQWQPTRREGGAGGGGLTVGTSGLCMGGAPDHRGGCGATGFRQAGGQSSERQRETPETLGALLGVEGHLFGVVGVHPAGRTVGTKVGAGLVVAAAATMIGVFTLAVYPPTSSTAPIAAPYSSITSDHGVGEILAVAASEGLALASLQSPHLLQTALQSRGGVVGPQAVVLVVVVVDAARSEGDVRLDLLTRPLSIAWGARDLKDGVPVTAGGHDVRASLLLDALDGGALGADHQAHHTVWNPYLDGGLARQRRGWRTAEGDPKLVAGCPQHREVLGRRDDLASRQRYVFLAASDEEDRLLTPNRRFDVGVGLGSECLDLAPCRENTEAKPGGGQMFLSRGHSCAEKGCLWLSVWK